MRIIAKKNGKELRIDGVERTEETEEYITLIPHYNKFLTMYENNKFHLRIVGKYHLMKAKITDYKEVEV